MTKKTAPKKAVKKAQVKKVPTKKVATKKKVTKTAAKKVANKGSVKTKTPVKKAPMGKNAKVSKIIARVDVGFGNSLYVRGNGAGLSWDKGTLLENNSPYEWALKLKSKKAALEFKYLINDVLWADGDNLKISAGETSISTPNFYC